MAKGLTNAEIGRVLGISAGTAKVHVSRVIAALDVTNRTEAAVALQELRSLGPDSGDPVPGFGQRPAIVVLPFDNLSNDPAQGHFADGLVEDLTTQLSAWRWFPVIARTSAFEFRTQPTTVPKICEQLGARYCVEGSTRSSGDRVRVQVQLIDGASGEHAFAQKYDRVSGDVFALQDEIVEAIVGALEPSLLQVEGMRALRKPATSLDAWGHFQRGMALLLRQAPGFAEEALGHFDRSVLQDDRFAPAHAGRAMALYAQGVNALGDTHWKETSAHDQQRATEQAFERFRVAEDAGRTAVDLDPLDAAAHLGLAGGQVMQGKLDAALASLGRAIELNPSSPMACFALGSLLGAVPDRADESVHYLERAIRLSPHDPNRQHFEGALSMTYLRSGRYEQALPHIVCSLDFETEGAMSYLPMLAPCLAHLGRMDEAREAVQRVRDRWPDWNLSLVRLFSPPDALERVIEGYRLAGWDLS